MLLRYNFLQFDFVFIIIRFEDRNFTFIFKDFNNQYYSYENNIPS